MGKLLVLIIILFMTQALFSWFGFEQQSVIEGSPVSNNLFSYFKVFSSPENIKDVSIYDLIKGIFETVGVGAIVASFSVSNNKESFLLGGLAIVFLGFIADFASVITYLTSKAEMDGLLVPDPFAYVAIFIYGGLIVAYFFAIIDWWRGNA